MASPENGAFRWRVTGRVQGVWYRDTTRRKAQELQLKGSAVNLPDGSVEVIACGEAAQVEALCEWLWQGSEQSEVSGVSCETLEMLSPAEFVIG